MYKVDCEGKPVKFGQVLELTEEDLHEIKEIFESRGIVNTRLSTKCSNGIWRETRESEADYLL